MNPASIVVQQSPGRPEQLILMFHGMGGAPENLLPLGRRLASAFPASTVVCIAAPNVSGTMGGREWFSAAGVTEENRLARVAAAMPAYLAEIRAWQKAADVTPAVTALVGFSQGAIMALESTQQAVPVSAHIVEIAGRFASGPRVAPQSCRLHLLHGEADSVMPIALSIQAVETLRSLGARATLDRFPGLGHSIDARVGKRVIERIIERVGT